MTHMYMKEIYNGVLDFYVDYGFASSIYDDWFWKIFYEKGSKGNKFRIQKNGTSFPALVLTPKVRKTQAPGILWMHGGGYMTGMKEMVHMSRAVDLVKLYGATVISPVYTFVGDGESFYTETCRYVENLKKAGVEAAIDIYQTNMHVFDMMKPKEPLSQEAAKKFNMHFAYAM